MRHEEEGATNAWRDGEIQAQVQVPRHVRGWLDRIAALPGWRHPYGFCA